MTTSTTATSTTARPRLTPGPSPQPTLGPRPQPAPGPPSEPAPGPVLRRLADIVPPPPPATPEHRPAPPTLSAPEPGASTQVQRVLRATVEILGGRRPAHQLAAVLSPELLTYLVSLQAAAGPLQPKVRKVLTRSHGDRTLEAVALITLRTGVRALAARFEKHPDTGGCQWRCTALQLRFTTGDLAAGRR